MVITVDGRELLCADVLVAATSKGPIDLAVSPAALAAAARAGRLAGALADRPLTDGIRRAIGILDAVALV